jgi:predicted dinucleotide-binding enzyme
MTIAFVGYGQVGAPLADHLQRIGHEVTLAAKDPNSDNVRKALTRNASLRVAAPKDAVRDAEVVFLATPFQANQAAVTALADEHRAQVINYLKSTGKQLGLLVNFGHYPKIEHERFVNQSPSRISRVS